MANPPNPRIIPGFYEPVSPEARAQRERVYRLVGEYVVNWATVETLLIDCIVVTTGMARNQAMALYYATQSNRARLALVRAFAYEGLPTDERDQLLHICKRFKTATKLRNELVHSEYDLDDDTKMLVSLHNSNMDDYAGGEPTREVKLDFRWENRVKQASTELTLLNRDLFEFLRPLSKRQKRQRTPRAKGP
jgi:hypothetical protein